MTTTADAIVTLTDRMAFEAVSGSNHRLILDAPLEAGGEDRGPRPVEVLLMALGGCTGMDVVSILRKKRQDVSRYEVRVHGERVDGHPAVFETIEVEHVIHGRNLQPEAVRRAVELSATKYCPISAMLSASVQILERWRVVDDVSGVETAGALEHAIAD